MGRRLLASGLAVAALSLCGAAQAKSFVVLRMPDGSQTLIDMAAVEAEGAVRRTWTVTVRRNILDNGPPEPGYVRTLHEFDCARQVTRWRRFQAYSRTGSNLVTQENRSADWSAPDTSSEAIVTMRVICGISNGDAVISADTIGSAVIALLGSFEPAPKPPRTVFDETTLDPPKVAKPAPTKKKPAPAKSARKT